MHFRNTRGFTLLEILLTSSILLGLTLGVLISVDRYRVARTLGTDEARIFATLRDAQQRSLTLEVDGASNRVQWGVHFTNNESATDYYELITQAETGGVISIASGRTMLSSGIELSVPAPRNTLDVIFSPLTGIPLASGVVVIQLVQDPTHNRTITIDADGLIYED